MVEKINVTNKNHAQSAANDTKVRMSKTLTEKKNNKEIKECFDKAQKEVATTVAKNVLKEVLAKLPAANSLTKQRIDKLFRMFCFNHLCPIDKVDLTRLKWKDCSGCLLREIPYSVKGGELRDLCYAIWYEGVLND